jgi:hypothetical protein
MSTPIARFQDVHSGHFKRRLNQPSVEPRADSILSDMADGNLVTEFFFSFAGFSYAASHLILTLIGVMGDGQESTKKSDKEIARIARCDQRTVRRWRKAYLEESAKLNFFPLEIIEGDYDYTTRLTGPTGYRITFAEPLKMAVATARARNDYQTDRLHAIEEAARFHYEDIEQAPPQKRKRKPGRAVKTPTADLERAAKKIVAAQTSLKEMPARQRAAFVNGQGEEMRAALDQIRAQMAEFEALLSGTLTSVENEDVEDTQDKMSAPPPVVESAPAYVRDSSLNTTRTLPEREHTPKVHAVFDNICRIAAGQPKVASSQYEIAGEPSLESDNPSG